jgi:hypothetical protein
LCVEPGTDFGQTEDGFQIRPLFSPSAGLVVGDLYLAAKLTQFFDQAYHFDVAQVWAVFFEGQARYQYAGAGDGLAITDHGFYRLK